MPSPSPLPLLPWVERLTAETGGAFRSIGLGSDLARVLADGNAKPDGRLALLAPRYVPQIAQGFGGSAATVQDVVVEVDTLYTATHYADPSGELMVYQLETLQLALWPALFGWAPPDNQGATVSYRGGGIVPRPFETDASVIWYRDRWAVDRQLRAT